jgi:7-keto-8-aminopelargonate synthetase-like enzyme
MTSLDQELAKRLEAWRQQGLERALRPVDSPQGTQITIDGRSVVNFASNDYLGLANHPQLQEAAREAITRYGTGAGAARLLSGSLPPHHQLEESLAAFKGTPAALSFSSGYTTALGTIPALVGPDDVVIIDRLAHACLIDAARLSRARLRVFAHNEVADLERILQQTTERSPRTAPQITDVNGEDKLARRPRILIVTESVFSMDGDVAPLAEITDLKDGYGAWLMVDEAHATGLVGTRRRGWIDALGLADRIEIQMGTLGKALGASGGFVCGSRILIRYLLNRARSFVFSTAPAPANSAAATAAIDLIQGPEGATRCDSLWQRVEQLHQQLGRTSAPSPIALSGTLSAIVPIPIGPEAAAVDAAQRLFKQGFYVPAIRYPTVTRGQARLRVSLSAAHTQAEVERLGNALHGLV